VAESRENNLPPMLRPEPDITRIEKKMRKSASRYGYKGYTPSGAKAKAMGKAPLAPLKGKTIETEPNILPKEDFAVS
jgi:hypothetical protein